MTRFIPPPVAKSAWSRSLLIIPRSLVSVSVGLFLTAGAHAQTTYNIANNGTWITPATWSPQSEATGPLATDHISITSLAGSRTVSLHGGQTNGSTAGTYTIASIAFDDSLNATFNGVGGSGAPTFNITGNITKEGSGRLIFQNSSPGANMNLTVGGNATIHEGSLEFSVNKVDVTGATTVKADASLTLATLAASSLGIVTLESGSSLQLRSGTNLSFTLGNLSGAGDISLVNTHGSNVRTVTLAINTDSGNYLHSGLITGSGTSVGITLQLTKSGVGRQTLTGETNFNGTTTVNGGVLEFSGDSSLTTGNINLAGGILGLGTGNLTRTLGTTAGQIQLTAAASGFAAYGDNRTVTLNDNATLTWGLNSSSFMTAGSNQQRDNLVLGDAAATHTVTLTNAINLNNAARTITVGNGAAAVDASLTGILSGTGSSALIKAGAGTLALTAANTYGAGTTISAGTLLANNSTGSATGLGAISLGASGSLGGTGSVAGLVTTAASTSGFSAGDNSAATLTLAGGLNAANGATFNFELGSISDKITITGGAFTGATNPGGLVFNFSVADGLSTGLSYTLFDYNGATSVGLDVSDFALSSTSIASGFVLDATFGTDGWLIDTTNKLVQVRFSEIPAAVPEPGTVALLAGASVLLVCLGRRQKRPSA